MCCRKSRNYTCSSGFRARPQQGSLLLSAFAAYVASRAGPISDNKEVRPHPVETKSPSTNMTLRVRKEEEAAVASSRNATGRTNAAQVPDEPPPAYQDVIAELPGSATSPKVANRDDSDPESDSDGILTPPQQNPGHIPGDNKYQADADMRTDADIEASLPQSLKGTLSPGIQVKVDTLLAALENYRRGTGRRIPVKRARRDLLNQLYDDQIRNQENATGARLRPREKAAIWKDLKGLRDDMWVMVRDAKRSRRQWA